MIADVEIPIKYILYNFDIYNAKALEKETSKFFFTSNIFFVSQIKGNFKSDLSAFLTDPKVIVI